MYPKLNRVKEVLKSEGRTNNWLAAKMGKNAATVSRWCSNQRQPPLETLYQIAEVLDVEVCDLLVPRREVPGVENE